MMSSNCPERLTPVAHSEKLINVTKAVDVISGEQTTVTKRAANQFDRDMGKVIQTRECID